MEVRKPRAQRARHVRHPIRIENAARVQPSKDLPRVKGPSAAVAKSDDPLLGRSRERRDVARLHAA
jgi:hypothetical protein